jgi:hypothetical protein
VALQDFAGFPDLKTLRRQPWFAPTVLGLGFLLLGVAAGLLAASVAPGPFRLGEAANLALAGVLWVPLTFAITALARWIPWDPSRRVAFFAVHLPASLVTSIALNAGFFGVLFLAGELTASELAPAVIRESVLWLHLNAAAYGAIVAAVHLLDGRGLGTEVSEGRRRTLGMPSGAALSVPSSGGHVRLPWAEISRIEADGDYVRVHAGERSYLLSLRMKELETRLAGSPLVRVHRSTIVNAEHVREIRHRSHGDCDATLADGTVVRVSRTRRAALLRRVTRGGRSNAS